jgi:hypothetical protein
MIFRWRDSLGDQPGQAQFVARWNRYELTVQGDQDGLSWAWLALEGPAGETIMVGGGDGLGSADDAKRLAEFAAMHAYCHQEPSGVDPFA